MLDTVKQCSRNFPHKMDNFDETDSTSDITENFELEERDRGLFDLLQLLDYTYLPAFFITKAAENRQKRNKRRKFPGTPRWSSSYRLNSPRLKTFPKSSHNNNRSKARTTDSTDVEKSLSLVDSCEVFDDTVADQQDSLTSLTESNQNTVAQTSEICDTTKDHLSVVESTDTASIRVSNNLCVPECLESDYIGELHSDAVLAELDYDDINCFLNTISIPNCLSQDDIEGMSKHEDSEPKVPASSCEINCDKILNVSSHRRHRVEWQEKERLQPTSSNISNKKYLGCSFSTQTNATSSDAAELNNEHPCNPTVACNFSEHAVSPNSSERFKSPNSSEQIVSSNFTASSENLTCLTSDMVQQESCHMHSLQNACQTLKSSACLNGSGSVENCFRNCNSSCSYGSTLNNGQQSADMNNYTSPLDCNVNLSNRCKLDDNTAFLNTGSSDRSSFNIFYGSNYVTKPTFQQIEQKFPANVCSSTMKLEIEMEILTEFLCENLKSVESGPKFNSYASEVNSSCFVGNVPSVSNEDAAISREGIYNKRSVKSNLLETSENINSLTSDLSHEENNILTSVNHSIDSENLNQTQTILQNFSSKSGLIESQSSAKKLVASENNVFSSTQNFRPINIESLRVNFLRPLQLEEFKPISAINQNMKLMKEETDFQNGLSKVLLKVPTKKLPLESAPRNEIIPKKIIFTTSEFIKYFGKSKKLEQITDQYLSASAGAYKPSLSTCTSNKPTNELPCSLQANTLIEDRTNVESSLEHQNVLRVQQRPDLFSGDIKIENVLKQQSIMSKHLGNEHPFKKQSLMSSDDCKLRYSVKNQGLTSGNLSLFKPWSGTSKRTALLCPQMRSIMSSRTNDILDPHRNMPSQPDPSSRIPYKKSNNYVESINSSLQIKSDSQAPSPTKVLNVTCGPPLYVNNKRMYEVPSIKPTISTEDEILFLGCKPAKTVHSDYSRITFPRCSVKSECTDVCNCCLRRTYPSTIGEWSLSQDTNVAGPSQSINITLIGEANGEIPSSQKENKAPFIDETDTNKSSSGNLQTTSDLFSKGGVFNDVLFETLGIGPAANGSDSTNFSVGEMANISNKENVTRRNSAESNENQNRLKVLPAIGQTSILNDAVKGRKNRKVSKHPSVIGESCFRAKKITSQKGSSQRNHESRILAKEIYSEISEPLSMSEEAAHRVMCGRGKRGGRSECGDSLLPKRLLRSRTVHNDPPSMPVSRRGRGRTRKQNCNSRDVLASSTLTTQPSNPQACTQSSVSYATNSHRCFSPTVMKFNKCADDRVQKSKIIGNVPKPNFLSSDNDYD